MTEPVNADGEQPLERRWATVMYADVANYSGLCAIDEDGTHRQLERYLGIFAKSVERYAGQVHHYAGDAVLATFDAAEPAVACAVAIQRRLAELNKPVAEGQRVEFRIGINRGSVIPKGGDVYGEDVNVAARLESLSPPGGVCVSENVRQAVDEIALHATVTYLGERSLKNIPRRVAAYLVELDDANERPGARFRARSGAWLELPRQPSLAILPFRCMEEDETSAQFADGLTMEVMTELIKLSGLFLASDFSTLRYRRENPSFEAISRELGVRYLLQGTVRRSGDRLRVHAELIDAANGRKMWAERYDDELDDVFEIQDAIAASIITALDVKLVSGGRSHVTRRSLSNREALRLYYSGWSHLISGAREDLILAQREFEAAAELEPESPLPPAMASWTYWWVGFRVLAADPQKVFEKAEQFALRARSMDDPSGFSSLVMAHLYLLRREHEQALDAAAYALDLRPSCDVSAATYASVLNYLGRSEEAIQYAERAIRLTPLAPTIYPGILASSYYGAGRFEEAVMAAQSVIGLNQDAIDAWLVLAAAESALGNFDAARRAIEQAKKIKPDISVDDYLKTQPYVDEEPVDLLRDRLRSAGLG